MKLLTILLVFASLISMAQVKDALHPSPQNAILEINDNGIAQISWEDPALLNGVIFFEGFESGITSADWTLIDADSDGEQWEMHPEDWSPAYGGAHSIASYSWFNGNTLTPNNWIITPAIVLPVDAKLQYFVAAISESYPVEHYQIRISTTDTNLESFTSIAFEETLGNGAHEWTQKDVDLSLWEEQTVYIAFVHNESSNQFALKIDDIVIHTVDQARDIALEAYSITRINPNGTSENIGETSAQVTNFTDTINLEGAYSYQIKAIYNDQEQSSSEVSNTVTYIDWLPALETLTAERIGNLVTLSWSSGNNQNKTLINETFENPVNLSNWSTLDFDSDDMTWEIHTATNAYEGQQCAASYSWLNGVVLTPNNWLMSNSVPIRFAENITCTWNVAGINASHSNEYYQFRVSSEGADTSNFIIEFNETLPQNDATWKNRSVSLNPYIGDTITIGFVHQQSTDIFGLKLDNIKLSTTNSIIGYNIYKKRLSDNTIEHIAEIDENTQTYTDTLKAIGEFQYIATAIYAHGGEGKTKQTITYTSTNLVKQNTLRIFPNPNNGSQITIYSSEPVTNILLIDTQGKIVEQKKNLNVTRVNFSSNLTSGIYFIKCKTATNNYIEKLIIN